MPAAETNHEDTPQSPGSDDPDSSCPDDNPEASAHGGLSVALTLHIEETNPPLSGWLDAQLGKAASLAGVKQASLSLAVVGDKEMAQLHEQYTGVAGTTDVLTFDLKDHDQQDQDDHCIEGDIVVCLDEAKRQAAERNHPVRHELLLYAVHGLLHLLGEDDHDEDAYQRMHAREDELLQSLGIGRVFNKNLES